MDQLSSSQAQEAGQLVMTIPFIYNYFLTPANTIHQAICASDWRSEKSSSNAFFQQLPIDSLIYDNLLSLRDAVDKVNKLYAAQGVMTILNDFRITDLKITVSIIGNHSVQDEMNAIRLLILKSYTQLSSKEIIIDPFNQHYLFNEGVFKSEFLLALNQLANYAKSSVFVCSTSSPNKFLLNIFGTPNRTSTLENKIRLYIDSLNPLYFTDYLEIEKSSLIPLIGGNEFSNFKTIVKQTGCQLYLPNLVPQLFHENSLQSSEIPKIYITGIKSLVLLAKKSLGEILQKIRKTPFIKQISVMPIKRELLILLNTSDKYLKDIMFSTGCYIHIPVLGFSSDESGDIVSFQANSVEAIDLAIESFMNHFTKLYTGKYNLVASYSQTCDIKELLNFTDTLSFSCNTLVSVSNIGQQFVFQLIGSPANIKSSVTSLSQFKNYINCESVSEKVSYQIELSNSEKDFIAGKKNGKIIKIMNMSSVQIKLLPFTECNFIVEISCNDLLDSALGLGLFEDELPTTVTFNIPESFHRQIIGVGGQTVQAIMRKFNVFIKFSNSFELNEKAEEAGNYSSNFQQSFTRKNNVIIKCPSKNKHQIPLAKTELESLVGKVMNSSYFHTSVDLTNCQWKLMISEQCNSEFNANKKKPTNFITEFEKTTNTYIHFPRLEQVEKDQDIVQLIIYGVESNSVKCAAQMRKLLPLQYKFSISANYKAFKEINDCCKNSKSVSYFTATQTQLDFLNKIMVPLKLLFNMEVETVLKENVSELILHYYPSSFTDRYPQLQQLSLEEQQELTSTNAFKDIVLNVSNFFSEHNFMVINQCVNEVEFAVNYPDSPKKEHRAKSADNILASTAEVFKRSTSTSPQKENEFNFMFSRPLNRESVLLEKFPNTQPQTFQLFQEPVKSNHLFSYDFPTHGNFRS